TLKHTHEHRQTHRHYLGVERANVERQKERQLSWTQCRAFLADANVVGQRGEIKETTQHVVDEGAAKHEISQVPVIAHRQRGQKRHCARSRKQVPQIKQNGDGGGKYGDLNGPIRQRIERKKVIQRQIIHCTGGPLRI